MRLVRLPSAIVLAVACAVTAGTIAPAGGPVIAEPAPPGPSGDIGTTFTPRAVPGPCITIGGPSTVDFGLLSFGEGFTPAGATTPVTSCGPADGAQDILASVSAATSGGIPRWTPFDCGTTPPAACVTPTDRFAYLLGGASLTSTARTIAPVGATLTHQLRLPAPGSQGGGEVVTMTVTILGVLR
jgi:hypothetical protein